ncbi:MAG: aspartate kinase [Bacteroidota bacterium]
MAIVLKFGGTSMNDHQTWTRVLEIINGKTNPVIIVSATARTTRQLREAAALAASGQVNEAQELCTSIKERHQELIMSFLEHHPHPKNQLIADSCQARINQVMGSLDKLLMYINRQEKLSPQLKDAVLSIGEQLSAYLFAQCGLAMDILTHYIDARKIIRTDSEFGRANPNTGLIYQKALALESVMDGGFIPVIGGFYGESDTGMITTLGFEGSDYSASLIGAALQADSIEIWTDVSGVYTSDPRFIPKAKPIAELSYFDATEMAYFGARVLHPSTLKPAQERNIPVWVKNMFAPDDHGTKIIRSVESGKDVLALSFKENMAIITITAYETLMGFDFLTRVFHALQELRIPVDAVNTTESSVTIALSDGAHIEQLTRSFIALGTVSTTTHKGLITLIGCTFDQTQTIKERVLGALPDVTIDMISYTKEKRIFNVVLEHDLLVDTSRNIHDALFLS